jgi:ankyrin repeat protein
MNRTSLKLYRDHTMPSDIMQLLYHGDRPAAASLALHRDLDVFEAAALGALEALIERCEEDPSRVSAFAEDGWTPLHLAAFFGNLEIAKELLRRDAVIDARSRSGNVTPLQSACAGDHTLVASLLIAAGADVNARQDGGHTALDSARRNGNTEILALLSAAGAT